MNRSLYAIFFLCVALVVLGFLYTQGPETKTGCTSTPVGSNGDRSDGNTDGKYCGYDVRVRTNAWDKIYGAVVG